MNKIISLIFIISTLLLFAGCNDTSLNSDISDDLALDPNIESEMRAPAPGNQTIADIVIDAATADVDAEFTLLLDALVYADLADVFAGNAQYTVFAPTDEAFGNLVDAVSGLLDPDILEEEGPFAAIDALLGEGTIADVLLYHVTQGRRAANSVVPRNQRARDRTINTLLGTSFSVNSNGEITAVGNSATIVTPDLSASNGIIHIIDTVLLPIEL